MAAHTVTRKLLAAVEALPPERQVQLLEVARAWAMPPGTEGISRDSTACVLHAMDRLDQGYLNLARAELRSPPDLATVRAALTPIRGSLSADCIAERDERELRRLPDGGSPDPRERIIGTAAALAAVPVPMTRPTPDEELNQESATKGK